MAGHTQYHDPFWGLEVVAGWPCGFSSLLGTQNFRLTEKFFVSDKQACPPFACRTKDVCVTHWEPAPRSLLPNTELWLKDEVVAH